MIHSWKLNVLWKYANRKPASLKKIMFMPIMNLNMKEMCNKIHIYVNKHIGNWDEKQQLTDYQKILRLLTNYWLLYWDIFFFFIIMACLTHFVSFSTTFSNCFQIIPSSCTKPGNIKSQTLKGLWKRLPEKHTLTEQLTDHDTVDFKQFS